jgi:hypothetical protein
VKVNAAVEYSMSLRSVDKAGAQLQVILWMSLSDLKLIVSNVQYE